MDLSIDQAAVLMGCTARQVRYLIANGRLKAHKAGGRWRIARADLPATEAQAHKVERLREAVEDALAVKAPETPEAAPRHPRRFSVRDLKAFQVARPVYDGAVQRLGADHPATGALRRALDLLAQGCHRFARQEKAAAYRDARDAASRAVCELLLSGDAVADGLATTVEQEMLPAVAGLLRRTERTEGRG